MRNTLGSIVLGAALALLQLAPPRAMAEGEVDGWTFSLTPYLWLSSVDGSLNYGLPPAGGASPGIDIDSDSLLDDLNLAFMITGEARKRRWLIATDVIYLDFSSTDSTVKSVDFNPGPGPVNVTTTGLDSGTKTDLSGWLWTAVGGYAAISEPHATLDVIAGFRYLDIKSTTDWQLTANVTGPVGTTPFSRSGRVERSESVWTGIVGLKGHAMLGASDWFVNYYADIGGGSSTFTWQGIAGLGYRFKWGDVLVDYRYLSYDQGDDKLVDDLSFGGPALGARFRF